MYLANTKKAFAQTNSYNKNATEVAPSSSDVSDFKYKYEHKTLYLKTAFFGGQKIVLDHQEMPVGIFYNNLLPMTSSVPEAYDLISKGNRNLIISTMSLLVVCAGEILILNQINNQVGNSNNPNSGGINPAASLAAFGCMIGGLGVSIGFALDGGNKIQKGIWVYNREIIK